jgi:hypothetical protein
MSWLVSSSAIRRFFEAGLELFDLLLTHGADPEEVLVLGLEFADLEVLEGSLDGHLAWLQGLR